MEDKKKKSSSRRKARDEVFKILFQSSMHSDNIEELFIYLLQEKPEMEKSMSYIRGTVLGCIEKNDEMENIISKNISGNWKITRISKVALNILKLAVYEMKYVEDVPEKVAIDEAVELAKKYSDEKNASFINGVLSGVYKQLNG